MLKISMKTVATSLTAFVVLGGLSQITKSELAAADGVPLSVVVAIGGQSETTLRFSAPAVTPLDVAVLLDSTGSQSQQLQQVKSIVKTAVGVAVGVDTFVAVAASGDVPVFPFGTASDKAYRLVQQSSADAAVFQSAMQNLGAVEGGGDSSEGQLPAIVHLLTGSDLGTAPVAEAGAPQTVVWRPEARRVLIVSSDGSPHVSTDQWCNEAGVCIGYPGPTTDEVQAALDAQGVSLVAITRGNAGVLPALAEATKGQTLQLGPLDSQAGFSSPVAVPPVPSVSGVPTSSIGDAEVSSSTETEPTVPTTPSEQIVSASSIETITSAILATPVAIRPRLGNCEGVSMEFQPAMARVKLGESADFTVTANADASTSASKRECIVSLGNGTEVTLSVTVALPCPDPSISTAISTATTLVAAPSSTLAEVQSVPNIPASTVPLATDPPNTTQAPTVTVGATGDSTTTTPATEPTTSTTSVPSSPGVVVVPESTTSSPPAELTTPTTGIPSTSVSVAPPDLTSATTTQATTAVPTSVAPTTVSSSLVEATEIVAQPSPNDAAPSSTTAVATESASTVPSTTVAASDVQSSVAPSSAPSSTVVPATAVTSSEPPISAPPTVPPISEVPTSVATTTVIASSVPSTVVGETVSTLPPETSTTSATATTTTQPVQECALLNSVTSTTGNEPSTSSVQVTSTTSEPTATTQPAGLASSSTTTSTVLPVECATVPAPESNTAGLTSSPEPAALLTDRQAGSGAPAVTTTIQEPVAETTTVATVATSVPESVPTSTPAPCIPAEVVTTTVQQMTTTIAPV